MDADYDILIVGGGLVGASLACALGEQPLRIGVIEAVPFGSVDQPSYDDRSLALSFGSRRIIESIGLWQDVADLGATPIKRIHVSDRGHGGFTRLDCRDMRVDALGYVVVSRVYGKVLSQRLDTLDNVDMLCPARVDNLVFEDDCVRVNVREQDITRTLSAKLLIGADGVQSTVRELAGITTQQSLYGQTAIISNITTEQFHDFTAYERFTTTGPIAVLPASTRHDDGSERENRCAVVWTVNNDQAETIKTLGDEAFLTQLQARFGNRLKVLSKIGKRSAYPLSLTQAQVHTRSCLALIGNAAHTLHPIAGQGFNLGLRDVATLAQVIVDATRTQTDPGSVKVLNEYAAWRRHDHKRVIRFTDSLVHVFSNAFPPLVAARNVGLLAADIFPFAKRILTRQAMGLSGRLPRLARGLPL